MSNNNKLFSTIEAHMRLLGVNKYIKVLRSSVAEHHGDNEKVGSSNLPEVTNQ